VRRPLRTVSFTLYTTPPFASSAQKVGKLFAEVTSLLPAAPTKGDMVFPKLRYMQVQNCQMGAPQIADLVYTHCHTVQGVPRRENFTAWWHMGQSFGVIEWDDRC
jgi:hypothetical protein